MMTNQESGRDKCATCSGSRPIIFKTTSRWLRCYVLFSLLRSKTMHL